MGCGGGCCHNSHWNRTEDQEAEVGIVEGEPIKCDRAAARLRTTPGCTAVLFQCLDDCTMKNELRSFVLVFFSRAAFHGFQLMNASQTCFIQKTIQKAYDRSINGQ